MFRPFELARLDLELDVCLPVGQLSAFALVFIRLPLLELILRRLPLWLQNSLDDFRGAESFKLLDNLTLFVFVLGEEALLFRVLEAVDDVFEQVRQDVLVFIEYLLAVSHRRLHRHVAK